MYDFDSIGTNYTLAAKDHDTNVFTKVSQRAQSMIAIKVLAHTSSLELGFTFKTSHRERLFRHIKLNCIVLTMTLIRFPTRHTVITIF